MTENYTKNSTINDAKNETQDANTIKVNINNKTDVCNQTKDLEVDNKDIIKNLIDVKNIV